MPENINSLEQLWNSVEKLNKDLFPYNALRPIIGNGKIDNPQFMFLFINPTHRNISSNRAWNGPCYPFVGTKEIWRILHRAELFDDTLLYRINNSKNSWNIDLAVRVLDFLNRKSIYITNLVKWTGSDATLPNTKKIKAFLPILHQEIEIVKPKYIVTFGLLPFEHLTQQKIKLQDYYNEVVNSQKLRYFNCTINKTEIKIIPCYFPVGRGNPKQAIEILKYLSSLD